MVKQIQIKRGLAANRTSITPSSGELLFTTDDKKVYVGDGSTAGGVAVAPTVVQKYELIATSNASGASAVDFTGLSSSYSHYIVMCDGIIASTFAQLYLRMSTDNGATFDTSTNYWDQLTTASGSTISTTSQMNAFLRIGNVDTTANYLRLILQSIGSARRVFVESMNGRLQLYNHSLGTRAVATAVNAIRIYPSTGTLTGIFYLYGVRT